MPLGSIVIMNTRSNIEMRPDVLAYVREYLAGDTRDADVARCRRMYQARRIMPSFVSELLLDILLIGDAMQNTRPTLSSHSHLQEDLRSCYRG